MCIRDRISETLAVLERSNEPFGNLRRHATTIESVSPSINPRPIRIAPQVTKVVQDHKAPIPEPHHLIALNSFRKLLTRLKLVKATHRIHELFITRHSSVATLIRSQDVKSALVKTRREKNVERHVRALACLIVRLAILDLIHLRSDHLRVRLLACKVAIQLAHEEFR